MKKHAEFIRPPDGDPPSAPPTSVWELTARYSLPTGDDDVAAPRRVFEVCLDDSWTVTTQEIFTAWTGRRRFDGVEYHGPVYHLGTGSMYRGARVCPCPVCETSVEPQLKKN